MAWHYGTYSCGHEGRTNVVGPTKNRDWIAEKHFSGLCSDCWEKKVETDKIEANAKALEKAKEMELPELQGTEKQVAWANTLRQKMIEDFEKRFESPIEKKKDLLREVLNHVLTTKTSASWYIDNRGNMPREIAENISEEIKKIEKIETAPVDIKIEATVYPENKITEAVAEISIKDNMISVKFEKNEKFISLVKSLNFKWDSDWNSGWSRNINELTGSAEDRATELGNKLLNAGFPIMIMDTIIRQNAIEGKFEPECNRWIKTSSNGSLAIRWWEENDKLYRTARSLSGSKWEDKSVVIKVQHYKEVQDFANMFGFKFTKSAFKVIEDYIESTKKIEIVTPGVGKKSEKKDGLTDILKSGDEIIDDLKD